MGKEINERGSEDGGERWKRIRFCRRGKKGKQVFSRENELTMTAEQERNRPEEPCRRKG